MVRSSRLLCAAAVALASAVALPAVAQPTQIRPGFNLFTPEQDVEIGRQSAAQAERQLPLLRDRATDAYLGDILRRLAPHAPGARFPYQVKAVNSAEVNAFALPGGFMYVNRGTIESADNEAELVGVMAHEMAHVALRHGTHQASRAYLAQAGLSVLGGILGGGRRTPTEIISVLGGLGLNALFLKYSRDMETQADLAGAQIMAGAGYDPEQMARMFDKLQQMHRSDPSRLARFFSDHPASADRAARIRQEARLIGPVARTADSGGFESVRSELRGRAPARAAASAPLRGTDQGRTGDRGRVSGNVGQLEPPSRTFQNFQQREGFFSLEYPDNWRAADAQSGYGASIVPDGGVLQTANGDPVLVCGAIINHYDPFADEQASGPLSLEQATNDIVAQVQQSNPYLQPDDSARRTTVDQERATRVVLSGRSPATGQDEQVTLYTRALPDDHFLYALFVTPRAEARTFEPAFSRMIETLQVNDRAAHR